MFWWRSIQQRREELHTAKYQLKLAQARYGAIEHELTALGKCKFTDPAYRANFSMLIDRYDDIATITKFLYRKKFCYIMTGKRWLLWGK